MPLRGEKRTDRSVCATEDQNPHACLRQPWGTRAEKGAPSRVTVLLGESPSINIGGQVCATEDQPPPTLINREWGTRYEEKSAQTGVPSLKILRADLARRGRGGGQVCATKDQRPKTPPS
jgi:hypothetical protein